MIVTDVTIGADPELFIIDEKTKKVVSSIGLIPGVKGDPWVGEDMPVGFGLETDNIVAEFNIPPVRDKCSFINNIEYMKTYIQKFVKNINPDLGILCAASREVDESQLNSPEAKLFGCEPDYNAYTEMPNPKPSGESTNLRSCGFHIHIGYKNPNIDTSVTLVRFLDAYLGLPSVLKDIDTNRRSLYGKAGAFRLTPYGVEYRVLSSAMMKNVDVLNFVWNQLDKAIEAYNVGSDIPRYSDTIEAINTSNRQLVRNLITSYKLA